MVVMDRFVGQRWHCRKLFDWQVAYQKLLLLLCDDDGVCHNQKGHRCKCRPPLAGGSGGAAHSVTADAVKGVGVSCGLQHISRPQPSAIPIIIIPIIIIITTLQSVQSVLFLLSISSEVPMRWWCQRRGPLLQQPPAALSTGNSQQAGNGLRGGGGGGGAV
jgi:hypothetical protein